MRLARIAAVVLFLLPLAGNLFLGGSRLSWLALVVGAFFFGFGFAYDVLNRERDNNPKITGE